MAAKARATCLIWRADDRESCEAEGDWGSAGAARRPRRPILRISHSQPRLNMDPFLGQARKPSPCSKGKYGARSELDSLGELTKRGEFDLLKYRASGMPNAADRRLLPA